jgi:oligopeptide/dipeptide ABC transporter ATP-binding protein
MRPLLELHDVSLRLPIGGRPAPILHDVSLAVGRGEMLGLVGESGSGKSMTLRSILRLLPRGAQLDGVIRLDGVDLRAARARDLRAVRGRRIAMVFQDPRAHINPVHRIGDFLTEALTRTRGLDPTEARRRAVTALGEVGISEPERRLRQFPHELSGGMLQRVMIASALLAEPELLLADEPTTALDVTTQSDVMAILDELRRERELAVLLVTHDIELAGAMSDRLAVMYAGSIVEQGTPSRMLSDPLHPYTAALVAAQPDIERRRDRLAAIPGRPLSASEAPQGCAFRTRCPFAQDACADDRPQLEEHDRGLVRCRRAGELHPAAQIGGPA